MRPLPIGSSIDEYIQLFRRSGGDCINVSSRTGALYRCRYTHPNGVFTQAEWIVDIKADSIGGGSAGVSVEYFVTGP